MNSPEESQKLCQNLDDLGTKLRDETFRASDEAFSLIVPLIASFRDEIASPDVVSSILRVFVNLSADNDKNRLEMIQHADLWETVLKVLDNPRTAIFLGQFVKNSEHSPQFQRFFYDLKIYHPLIDLLAREKETDLQALEFLHEIVKPEFVVQDREFEAESERYLKVFIEAYARSEPGLDEEEEKEKYEWLSGLMYTITQYEMFDTSFMRQIYPLFDIPTDNSKTNRQLFSTIGNLSSMKNFEDFTQVEYAMAHIGSITNPYLKAAYYLVVGNFVTDAEKSALVNGALNEDFLDGYFNTKFTDIVQYQSIHTIKNLVNVSNSSLVINHPNLVVFAKVLVDNQNYYKEIYTTFTAFLKKLIKVACKDNSIYDHIDLWTVVDSPQIYIELAEFVNAAIAESAKVPESPNSAHDCEKLNAKILSAVFTDELPQDAGQILSRLKAQAVLLKGHLNFVRSSLDPEKFLVQYKKLYEMVQNSDSSHPQFDILRNNAKFVSASLMALENEQISTVAKDFLNI